MSAIVCCVDADGLVLGSDSRFMRDDFSGVLSDEQQKIIPLQGDLFFAATGWSPVISFQERKARELAATVSDIRDLSAALDEASRGPLKQLAADLEAMGHSTALPLHGSMLAGRNGDKYGYVYVKSWLRDGRIVSDKSEHFGDGKRHIRIANVGSTASELAREARTWTDDAALVVKRFLEAQRQDDPRCGGPDQIVTLRDTGARWVCPPPPAPEKVPMLAMSAIRASDAVFEASAIQTADIANAAITNAKIQSLEANKLTAATGYLNVAVIQDASLTSAKVQSLEANKLTASTGYLNTAVIENASLTNAKILSLEANKLTAATGYLNIAVIQDASITSAKVQNLAVSKLTGGTITATLTVNSGGTMTVQDTLSVGGDVAFFGSVEQFAGTAVLKGTTVTTLTSAGYVNSSTGFQVGGSEVINSSRQFVGAGVNVGSNGVGCGGINIGGTNVVVGRQTGPGSPSFASFGDVQTWCANLRTALQTHGLIT